MIAEQKINIFLRRGGMRGRRKDFGAAGSAEYMYYMQVNTTLVPENVTLKALPSKRYLQSVTFKTLPSKCYPQNITFRTLP